MTGGGGGAASKNEKSQGSAGRVLGWFVDFEEESSVGGGAFVDASNADRSKGLVVEVMGL